MLHLALYINQEVQRQGVLKEVLTKYFSPVLYIKDFFTVILLIALIYSL